MRIKEEFSRAVRAIEHAWIPLADGCRLAARIWLPEDADEDRVPAILEYIPYRKNDATATRDAAMHPYFAGHGYAAVRVDMRGSGDSDGILLDEYLEQEQDDALEVLAWLATQPWCTGRVGIIGKSWGGFNALQIAARRPAELGAVVSVCSTDDRYADDVHYVGGCLLASDMLSWASVMLAYNARPPDPAVVGCRWREMWLERLERTPPFIEAWLSHQRRDAFWKHGSVIEDYAAIECPVYAVGGWADGYTNAVPRLLAGLECPRKGLIGPWAHLYPHEGVPGPAIAFLHECLRWWDYWLKDEDTGIMDAPMLRAWMQDAVEPAPHYVERPGRWIAEESWPSPRIQTRTLHLNARSLGAERGEDAALAVASNEAAGLDAGAWCAWGVPGDHPSDQRREDALSLTFTSEPLAEPLELLGFPEVTLAFASDRPLALVAVRLCDVAPDGASALVSRGLLNLTHRESHEEPSPLEPGRRYEVTVPLKVVGQAVPAGHRLRVAVSPTYWPWAWPSPEPVTLTVFTGASRVELPVRPPARDDAPQPFGPPEGSPPIQVEMLAGDDGARLWSHDVALGVHELEVASAHFPSLRFLADGLEYRERGRDVYTIVEGEPRSAAVRCDRTVEVGRAAWRTRIDTVSRMSATTTEFVVTNVLHAYEGSVHVFSKTWSVEIPRDLV